MTNKQLQSITRMTNCLKARNTNHSNTWNDKFYHICQLINTGKIKTLGATDDKTQRIFKFLIHNINPIHSTVPLSDYRAIAFLENKRKDYQNNIDAGRNGYWDS